MRTHFGGFRQGAAEGAMWFVVPKAATLSESLQNTPEGLPVPPTGQRQSRLTMNHIAFTLFPRQQTGQTILMGHSHRDLVLLIKSISSASKATKCTPHIYKKKCQAYPVIDFIDQCDVHSSQIQVVNTGRYLPKRCKLSRIMFEDQASQAIVIVT